MQNATDLFLRHLREDAAECRIREDDILRVEGRGLFLARHGVDFHQGNGFLAGRIGKAENVRVEEIVRNGSVIGLAVLHSAIFIGKREFLGGIRSRLLVRFKPVVASVKIDFDAVLTLTPTSFTTLETVKSNDSLSSF